jgi:hypothetical protein
MSPMKSTCTFDEKTKSKLAIIESNRFLGGRTLPTTTHPFVQFLKKNQH